MPPKGSAPGRRKIAGKVVDIIGNDTMTVVDVNVGKNGWKKSWRDHFGDVTEMIAHVSDVKRLMFASR